MLLGRHYASMVNREAMLQAIEYFRQALELAPDNAMCWVELGIAESASASYGWSEFSEGYEKASAAARKALSIQPDLAAGHALTGWVQLEQNFDFRGAEASIRRAIELEPDNIFVLGLGAFVLGRFVHRLEETLDICRRVLLLDPLNIRILNAFALAAYFAGHLDEAETASRRLIEIAPQGVGKRAYLGLMLLDKGRVDEARSVAAAEPEGLWRLWSLAIIENAAGQENEARFALDDLIARYSDTAPFQIAEVYSTLGESDKAFEWLERAVAGHDPGTAAIAVSPLLKPIHGDPRWPALLDKIGYPTGEEDRDT
jgi:serine/threonine-protein kinase